MRAQGDYEGAAALFEEGLTLSRKVGDKRVIANALTGLGTLARLRGDYERAAALFMENLTLFGELRFKLRIGDCLEALAGVACAQGHFERAARLFGAAEAMREAIAVPIWPVTLTEHNRNVTAVRMGLGEETFTSAWGEGRAMPMEQAIAYALART